MDGTLASLYPCEDCEDIPAQVYCGVCGTSLCEECDAHVHHLKSRKSSHVRTALANLSPGNTQGDVVNDLSDTLPATVSSNVPSCTGIFDQVDCRGDAHAGSTWSEQGVEGSEGTGCSCELSMPALVDSGEEGDPGTPDASYMALTEGKSGLTGGMHGGSEEVKLKKKKKKKKKTKSESQGQAIDDVEGWSSSVPTVTRGGTTLNKHCSDMPSLQGAMDTESSESMPGSLKIQMSPKLMSALKGGHEEAGQARSKALRVQWAPDVQDPVPNSQSHTLRPSQHYGGATLSNHRASQRRKDVKGHYSSGNYHAHGGHGSGKSEKKRLQKLKKSREAARLAGKMAPAKEYPKHGGLEVESRSSQCTAEGSNGEQSDLDNSSEDDSPISNNGSSPITVHSGAHDNVFLADASQQGTVHTKNAYDLLYESSMEVQAVADDGKLSEPEMQQKLFTENVEAEVTKPNATLPDLNPSNGAEDGLCKGTLSAGAGKAGAELRVKIMDGQKPGGGVNEATHVTTVAVGLSNDVERGGGKGQIVPAGGKVLQRQDVSVGSTTEAAPAMAMRKDSSKNTMDASAFQKAKSCMQRAELLAAQGNMSGSLVEYEAAVRAFRRVAEAGGASARMALTEEALVWQAMASLASTAGDDAAVGKYHLAAMQAYHNLGQEHAVGDCLLKLGRSLLLHGEPHRARAAFLSAICLLGDDCKADSPPGDEARRGLGVNCNRRIGKDSTEAPGSGKQQPQNLRSLAQLTAGRLAGVAAVQEGDQEGAKELLVGALVSARRQGIKAEEAKCLRILADMQMGEQRERSLLAAVQGFREASLAYEEAEARFRLGKQRVELHLHDPHAWKRQMQSGESGKENLQLVRSAREQLETAASILLRKGSANPALRSRDSLAQKHAAKSPPQRAVLSPQRQPSRVDLKEGPGSKKETAQTHKSVPRKTSLLDRENSPMHDVGEKASLVKQGLKGGRSDALDPFSEEETMASGQDREEGTAVLLASIHDVWGRALVLLGQLHEAREHFQRALENEQWRSSCRGDAKQAEALLGRLPSV